MAGETTGSRAGLTRPDAGKVCRWSKEGKSVQGHRKENTKWKNQYPENTKLNTIS